MYKNKPEWTQQDAINLCVKLEELVPLAGCHVALTGGTLYKSGTRKDCDILFYRIRQTPEIAMPLLFSILCDAGVKITSDFGWVLKGEYEGKDIDMFFPEAEGGSYGE